MNKKTLLITVLMLSYCKSVWAQFAPQAGLSGTTAIHKSSADIKAWATHCTVKRGFVYIGDKSMDTTSTGINSSVLNVADGDVLSLGDSGIATVQFNTRIFNGAGADFVVFENGFKNPANPEEGYLELAFVEVSSDGVNFFRFPATSNTTSTVQINGVGEYMNARYINNLAGKYVSPYGTPFDLDDLKETEGLDRNNISHVRIVDVVGSIGQWGNRDQNGQIINDPFPTPFPTGGFDLDAVGAIHVHSTSVQESLAQTFSIYPNPASDKLFLSYNLQFTPDDQLLLLDIWGKTLQSHPLQHLQQIDINHLAQGLYLVYHKNAKDIRCVGKFSKI